MLVEKDGGQAEEFFRDGEETALFAGVDDLKTKIDHYLRQDGERRRIAVAAQKRMIENGHFYTNRMERMVRIYGQLRGIGYP